MQIEEFNDFIEVRSKRKKNVKESQTELRLKLNENNNNKDEGISSASPTESDQGAPRFVGFSSISRFLERILMEHIVMKNSLESWLSFGSNCVRSRPGNFSKNSIFNNLH